MFTPFSHLLRAAGDGVYFLELPAFCALVLGGLQLPEKALTFGAWAVAQLYIMDAGGTPPILVVFPLSALFLDL